MFKSISLIAINLIMLIAIIRLLLRKNLLIEFSGGRWWLTWLSMALITFIVELSSIFYAPAELFKISGLHTLFFIILSFFFFHYLTSRFVEISEIMENNNIREGGVYAFSEFVLGPNLSFLVASSLLVTYILTSCISSVSAAENNLLLFGGDNAIKLIASISIIWLIACLNVLGIKVLHRASFIIFLVFILILTNFFVFCIFSLDIEQFNLIKNNVIISASNFWDKDLLNVFVFLLYGLSITSLSFNGLDSLLSSFKYARNWKVVGRSYLFLFILAFIIPFLIIIFLTGRVDVTNHYGDLLPAFFGSSEWPIVGVVIAILSGLFLMIVVNYSFVAFSELMQKISQKFNFRWFLKTNRQSSLYRVHIIFACICTVVLLILNASQSFISIMLSMAILSNLSLILGTLLIYRYFRGTKESTLFYTSKIGTFVIFVLLISCLIYLTIYKVFLSLFLIVVTASLFFVVSKVVGKYFPAIKEKKQIDNPMDLVFYLSENSSNDYNIYFTREVEKFDLSKSLNSVYINFFQLTENVPSKTNSNHFRFLTAGPKLLSNIQAILELLKYELSDFKLKIHFGWPLSSWIDRISIGVVVFTIMKLPKQYPEYEFFIEYNSEKSTKYQSIT